MACVGPWRRVGKQATRRGGWLMMPSGKSPGGTLLAEDYAGAWLVMGRHTPFVGHTRVRPDQSPAAEARGRGVALARRDHGREGAWVRWGQRRHHRAALAYTKAWRLRSVRYSQRSPRSLASSASAASTRARIAAACCSAVSARCSAVSARCSAISSEVKTRRSSAS